MFSSQNTDDDKNADAEIKDFLVIKWVIFILQKNKIKSKTSLQSNHVQCEYWLKNKQINCGFWWFIKTHYKAMVPKVRFRSPKRAGPTFTDVSWKLFIPLIRLKKIFISDRHRCCDCSGALALVCLCWASVPEKISSLPRTFSVTELRSVCVLLQPPS